MKAKLDPAELKMASMRLTLLLIVFLGFIGVIAWGRYAEYALKKKVSAVLRRTPCPGCGRNLNDIKLTPIKKSRRRATVSVPQEAFPGMYSTECRRCGKALVCEAERGGIRLF